MSKRKLHKKDTITTDIYGKERCSICGATRNPHFTYGYYPWRLYSEPMPYCLEKYRLDGGGN